LAKSCVIAAITPIKVALAPMQPDMVRHLTPLASTSDKRTSAPRDTDEPLTNHRDA
jgi:hypothetical protein